MLLGAFVALTVWVAFAFIGAQMARSRGRDPAVWAIICFVLPLVGIIALLISGSSTHVSGADNAHTNSVVVRNNPTASITTLVGRILIAMLFLLAGLGKMADVQGLQAYLAWGGLPAFLAWPAILFEVAVGILLIVGYQTRIVAVATAGFCLITALLFHLNFADQMEVTMFLKNVAIAGGLLTLAAHGAGRLALDKA